MQIASKISVIVNLLLVLKKKTCKQAFPCGFGPRKRTGRKMARVKERGGVGKKGREGGSGWEETHICTRSKLS